MKEKHTKKNCNVICQNEPNLVSKIFEHFIYQFFYTNVKQIFL